MKVKKVSFPNASKILTSVHLWAAHLLTNSHINVMIVPYYPSCDYGVYLLPSQADYNSYTSDSLRFYLLRSGLKILFFMKDFLNDLSQSKKGK